MLRFQEAQELFRKHRDRETAEAYHRAAWKAYLGGRIEEAEISSAMTECEEFWRVACAH